MKVWACAHFSKQKIASEAPLINKILLQEIKKIIRVHSKRFKE
jgi:hypothetical protein